MTHPSNKLSQFWQELKRHRVIHVIIVYATSAFIIIQLITDVAEPLGFPDVTTKVFIIILAIIFPIAILPFHNFTRDPNQDFICFGLTDEIIGYLYKIESFGKVSSFSQESE